ncbi:S8 family serine peptidase [Streptomyces harbinensis]|uniref:Type VII secretion-associated serine protease mycosin n=1 Tax=Streptomyces harbinensis TaxID=1176198 RepID=A0A1I6UBG4_9ACTN|nr:S8 family serine peptidase [Streptomyces harbinensis]SFS98849.1 type VII secretion-associated serine protease mycosin [Streptomyces harbinensis]
MTPTRRALVTTLALTAALTTALATTAQAADTPQHPWYFDTYRIDEVWEHTTGEGITVAVIDTGVDPTLPELQGQVLDGTDLTRSPKGAHVDEDGHGSDMASLVVGTGGSGIQGMAPGAEVLPIRASTNQLDFDGAQRWAEAIEYAVAQGAQIINISLGATDNGRASDVLADALASAARNDVLIFAAVGNDGDTFNTRSAPAVLDGVIGVAAVGSDGERAAYSTHGPQVALAAPGEGVPSHCDDLSGPACIRDGGGTSSATALASASAALIWAQHPDWTKNQVLRVMLNTAERADDQRRDDYTGYGVVRPDRVVLDGEGDPGDPDSPPVFRDWEAALDPPATPEPTPGTGPSPDAEPAPGPDAEAAATSDDASPLPWLLGAGAAVLVAGSVGWLLWRRRSGVVRG